MYSTDNSVIYTHLLHGGKWWKSLDLELPALLTLCGWSCPYAHFTEEETEAWRGLVTCAGLLNSNSEARIPETCIPDSKSHSLNTQCMPTTHPASGTFYILREPKYFIQGQCVGKD